MPDAVRRAILAAEDDPDDLFFLEEALKKVSIGHPLLRAVDGERALELARENKPMLILLDLKLPLMSGLEVLRELRRDPVTHRTPVLVLTASLEPKDIAQAYDLGANAYLVKPPTLDELIGLMHAVRDFWLFHNQYSGG